MKASDLFVKALEAEEVEYIFGIPGEENLDVLESLRTSTIRLVPTRHEQAAGFMAATYGRLTGKTGVCISTLGPGATNFVTAAAYAQLGAMPMLMITGQKPIRESKQGHFQIVDVVEMMRPLTKYTKQAVSGSALPSRVRESFRMAEDERPGAVHLEIPEDVARDEVPDGDGHIFPKDRVRRPIAEEKAVRKAVELITKAKMPLLMIGAGSNRKLTSKMLRRFVDKTGIWFFTTQMGKGVLDEDDPRFLGNAALSANDYVHCAIEKADLIINVGHDVVEKPPFFMQHGGRTVIHINFTRAEVDPVYFPQLEVIGDIANSIWQICEALPEDGPWDCPQFHRIKTEIDRHLCDGSEDDRFPLRPQRIVADVRAVMPNDGVICLDNGMYKVWFARNYRARERNTVLLDNALATMGAGLPSAIATKLVHPDRRVMAICGDGGFMMNSQELETAVRLGLDLVVLILNDNAWGMIKWKQESMGLADWGLDVPNPDFVKYAEAYGAKGRRIESSSEVQDVVNAAFEEGGVQVVEAPIDYSLNVEDLTTKLSKRTCTL